MASMWEKLKKIAMGGGMVKPVKKVVTDSSKAYKKMREKQSPSAKVIKQGKDIDKFAKKEVIRGKDATGRQTVQTKYSPVVEKTKGGDYEKYGKGTKTAQSFRDAFAGARKAFESGEGGKVFEWKGKKYSVARADDPKETGMKVSESQPALKGKSGPMTKKESDAEKKKKLKKLSQIPYAG